MNTLSVFLYLANVIPSVGTFLTVSGTFFILALVILFICAAMYNDSYDYKIKDGDKEPWSYQSIYKWFWIPLVAIFLGLLVPSERTMYMIAASELGEIAVMNEEVQEVFDALKNRILIELRPETEN